MGDAKMKLRIKTALLALSTGMIALSLGNCFFRFLGDAIADQFWLSRF
jgi:hypothetical protein